MTHNEIALIEHELEILRTRYTLMQRWGRILLVFFAIFLPLLAIAGAIYASFTDIVAALYIVGIGTCAAGAAWLAFRKSQLRWIDLASPQSHPRADGWISHDPRSEARIIEEMIALREKRLIDLKSISSQ